MRATGWFDKRAYARGKSYLLVVLFIFISFFGKLLVGPLKTKQDETYSGGHI